MNRSSSDVPNTDPYAVIRRRMKLVGRRMENLFSIVCVAALLLIPVLFAVAHIAADGAPWNFATGEKFNPFFHFISSYVWRSPAGWAMAACMAGFAFVLGFISWHAAKRGPGFFSWLTAVSAAMAMVLLLQAAWVPFKPDRETFSQIKMEMAQEPTHEAKRDIWYGGLYAVDMPLPKGATSPAYFKSLRSHWMHQQAIIGAQVLIMIAIVGASFLWTSRRPDRRFWRSSLFWAEWLVLIFVAGGIFGRQWLPDFNGLTQRLTLLGFYVWLLVIVREITRQHVQVTRTNVAGHVNELDESRQVVQAAAENLPSVADTPLQP